MNKARLRSVQLQLLRLWILSPERLWLLSTNLHRHGHALLAFWIKQLNSLLYRNSLAPGATVSPDIRLGHHSFGIVVDSKVVIGEHVKIWQNVTLAARSSPDSPAQIIIEDYVTIGANAVVISPRGRTLRIGRGARIGAGVAVTHDVPARATVVSAPPRVLMREPAAKSSGRQEPSGGEAGSGQAGAGQGGAECAGPEASASERF
jgi:serine O-acetyltransferase